MPSAVLYVAVVLVWGTLYIAVAQQVAAIEPEVAVVYRFAAAGIVLLGWCWWRGRPLRYTQRQHAFLAIQGVSMFSTTDLFMYNAIQHMTGGLMSLVFTLITILNVLFAAVLLGMPVRPRVVAGGLLGLLGMAIVFWPALAEFKIGSGALIGLGFALLATISASLAQIVSARNQRAGLPVLETTGYCMLYGALFSAVVALALGRPFGWSWSAPFLISFAHVVIPCSIFAWVALLVLLGRMGPDRVAYLNVLIPIVALTVSAAFEGLAISGMMALGIVIALLGNVLVLTTFQRTRAAPELIKG
ncbi:MAG: DMT family transporter [Alphaproteobacteria bacterium]|nr:DMT family transporter [Alphaproteobacteria bacterium]